MPKPTELCELAYKYGTDKCPQLKHSYTPVYYEMFKDMRNSVKKVLELGIGRYRTMREVPVIFDKGLNRYYHRGASLKMWRDFFPSAEIYGADIVPETLIDDERITCFLCDETKKEDVENLIRQTGNDIDIFIDDGSHKLHDQVFLAKTALPLLKKEVIYIIEDVRSSRQVKKNLSEYNCSILELPRQCKDDALVWVRNKL